MIQQFTGFQLITGEDMGSCQGEDVFAAIDHFNNVLAIVPKKSCVGDVSLFYSDAMDHLNKKTPCKSVKEYAVCLQEANAKECELAAQEYLKNYPNSHFVLWGVVDCKIEIR